MTGPKILVSRPKETAPGQAPPPSYFNAQQSPKPKFKSKHSPKPDTTRLKVVVRRLPPGLAQAEFETQIGEEWRINGGKVDYLNYKSGKVEKEAVLHLTHESHLLTLVERVKETTFTDAKGTINLSSYNGPPTVEFATFQRIPKPPRHDARQGLIDQDDEFIGFLEELTNPDAAKTPLDQSDKQSDKVSITPLVQFLKDKKAAKLKDHGKHRAGKESRKERSEKKEKKPVLLQKAKDTSKPESARLSRAKASDGPEKATPKKRDRAPMLNATQILHRDLGLQAGNANSRRARKKEPETEAVSRETLSVPGADSPKEAKIPPSPKTSKKTRSSTSKQTENEAETKEKTEPVTAGFVKHVDQSKGITDDTLRTSLSQYGAIVNLKIELSKGHAFVDFVDESSLQKAIAAGPIPVGDGKVSVELRRSRDELKRGNRPRAKPSKRETTSEKKPERARGRGRGKGKEQAT